MVSRDITDLRLAKEEVRKSEETLATFVDSATDRITIMDQGII